MKENYKVIKFQSGNIDTETYKDGDTLVTKHYHNARDAYVKELIYLKDNIKTVKHITVKGVTSKLEHFVDSKREGEEFKYFVSKADGSIKSCKNYSNGKLHGENITYNERAEIIKHEVFAIGKLVLKYVRENKDNNEITSVELIDKDSLENLTKVEYDKYSTYK